MKAWENRITSTSCGPVEYMEAGAGSALLYLHGTNSGNDLVARLEQRLVRDGFRVIAPNRPGYYGTPLDSGRTPRQCAGLMAELLDALHLDRVGVVGLSGGGPYVAAFAANYPERTAALVLLGAVTHRWNQSQWLPFGKQWALPPLKRRWLRPALHRVRQVESDLLCRFPRAFMKAVCGARYADVANDPAACAASEEMAQSAYQCRRQKVGVDNDIDNFLDANGLEPGQIDRPTLVIHDPLDPLVPLAHADWSMASIPTAERCQLRLGGHVLWGGEDVEEMYRRRTEFLHRHLRGAAVATVESKCRVLRTGAKQ